MSSLAAALLFAGIGVGVFVSRATGGNDAHQAAVSSPVVTATPSPRRTATATATPARTPTAPEAAATLAPAATPAPATETPIPTRTLPAVAGPAVKVNAVKPPVGTQITDASVTISVDVDYWAGPVSNTLGWTLYYCFSPSDCNTYSLESALDIRPGSSGSATLGGLFTSNANGLRPATICRMSVVIGHFLTPETRWQSELADLSACRPVSASIKVLDVQPKLGTVLAAGATVTVNIEYAAGPVLPVPSSPPSAGPPPATRISAAYYLDCAVGPAGTRALDIAPGSAGVMTIDIPTSPQSAGKALRHVSVRLLSGDTTLAAYSFGPC